MATYHPTEATILSAIIAKCGLMKREWFLALRSITQRPLSYFVEHKSDFDLNKIDRTYGFSRASKDVIYESEDYKSLFHLVACKRLWNPATHMFKVFVSLFFLRCLKKAGYFPDKEWKIPLSEDETLIGM